MLQQPKVSVVQLHLGAAPDPGAPRPTLMQAEAVTLLGFNAVNSTGEACVALAEFDGCLVTSFGYPNDEALDSHPLYSSGLGFYGIYEVQNSGWLAALDDRNRGSFPDHSGYRVSHFIVTFHDSTFEVLAKSIELEVFDDVEQRTLHTLMADQFRQRI